MQSHSAKDYAHLLRSLMPRGLAWYNPAGSVGDRDIQGEAEELARIEARAIYLVLKEFFAQTTLELLPEFELEYGLPDPCTTLGATYEERINDLLRKIRTIGGQSIAYLTEVVGALGIDIEIEEFQPFRADMSRAGDNLYSEDWWFVFLVKGPATRVYSFRADQNCAGDPLRWWRGNEIIECIINRLKPAHTLALFGYDDEGMFFLGKTDDGGVILRDGITDDSLSTVFIKDKDGNILVRDIVPPGADDVFTHESNGDVILKDDIRIDDD